MKTIFHNGKESNVNSLLMKPFLVSQSLKGIKTNTRRLSGLEIVNEKPNSFYFQSLVHDVTGKFTFAPSENYSPTQDDIIELKCNYGTRGDIIWVREMWSPLVSDWEKNTQEFIVYAADTSNLNKFKWRPSIHMPAIACRHFLEIVDIWPERLQEITEEDALAEGIQKYEHENFHNYSSKEGYPFLSSAKSAFKVLWQEINGDQSWIDNPWVWRIEYKAIEKPEGWDQIFPYKKKSKKDNAI